MIYKISISEYAKKMGVSRPTLYSRIREIMEKEKVFRLPTKAELKARQCGRPRKKED